MTYSPNAADLAVLREAAIKFGVQQHEERFSTVRWETRIGRQTLVADETTVLARPYAADFEIALRERMVADGWTINTGHSSQGHIFIVSRVGATQQGRFHDHPLLALAHAAKRAGAFERKEEA